MVLYDVTVDRWAEHDLADEYPNLVAGFLEQIEGWKQEMGITGPFAIYE